MRFIVYGVGAIGGTLAARLALSGDEVFGIARGAQLDAIRQHGLRLRTPSGTEIARFPCHADPAEIAFGPDDVIFLTMKSQDTLGALLRLRAAGVSGQAIVCAQNGVANERIALRYFPNVFGMTVIMPSTYMVPGEVVAFGGPKPGILDIGRYPSGRDATADAIAGWLERAGFAAFTHPAVMENKYAKLLLNLGNVIDAALGGGGQRGRIYAAARAEGDAVYKAAGIAAGNVGEDDPRRKALMQMLPIPGADRVGSSSAQSLARGAGSIETDYLNGEIVLLGRLHGVPVPVNAYLCALGQRLIEEKLQPGALSAATIESDLVGLLPP